MDPAWPGWSCAPSPALTALGAAAPETAPGADPRCQWPQGHRWPPQGTSTSSESSSCRAWQGTGQGSLAEEGTRLCHTSVRGEGKPRGRGWAWPPDRAGLGGPSTAGLGGPSTAGLTVPRHSRGGSWRGQGRERPLQREQKTNCIDRTWRAAGSGSPLRPCSSNGVAMGRNREQFFSRCAEKSIQVQALGAHTLRGSIPGAEDGREPPRPGGPWSKPFTAPLSKKDVCPGCGYLVPLLLSTALLTFPEM